MSAGGRVPFAVILRYLLYDFLFHTVVNSEALRKEKKKEINVFYCFVGDVFRIKMSLSFSNRFLSSVL